MNRERAYAAYIRHYNAFMASRFESREEVDSLLYDRVRAASAAYRAACAQEDADEEASPRAAEVRVFEGGIPLMPHPCDHPSYAAYAAAVRTVFNTNDEAEEDAAVATMQRLKAVWMEATDA